MGTSGVGEADGPQHLLRIVDVDVAQQGDAQEGQRLLAVDEGDGPRMVSFSQRAASYSMDEKGSSPVSSPSSLEGSITFVGPLPEPPARPGQIERWR